MDVTQTPAATPARPAATTAPAADATNKDAAAISSDFETFLRMLTVQMQNQDPMNPMDSTEFAVQLATFSSVEQQVKTNDLLKAMGTQLGVMGMSQLAGWIGMEARTAAPAWFDGAPISLSPEPAEAADSMALIVRDADGNEVQRAELPPSDAPISWNGTGPDGRVLPTGAYSFELQSLSKGDVLRTDPLETYAPVVEARTDKGQTVLVLQGGIRADPADVTALRSPGA